MSHDPSDTRERRSIPEEIQFLDGASDAVLLREVIRGAIQATIEILLVADDSYMICACEEVEDVYDKRHATSRRLADEWLSEEFLDDVEYDGARTSPEIHILRRMRDLRNSVAPPPPPALPPPETDTAWRP